MIAPFLSYPLAWTQSVLNIVGLFVGVFCALVLVWRHKQFIWLPVLVALLLAIIPYVVLSISNHVIPYIPYMDPVPKEGAVASVHSHANVIVWGLGISCAWALRHASLRKSTA